MLDFKVEMHPAAEFAILSRGDFRFFLTKPSGDVAVAKECRTGHRNLQEDGTVCRSKSTILTQQLINSGKRVADFAMRLLQALGASRYFSKIPQGIS